MKAMGDTLSGIPSIHARPKSFSRKNVENAFHMAFELIGGVPRLAMWADANPDKFYPLYSRMLPQKSELDIQAALQMVILPTKLDE